MNFGNLEKIEETILQPARSFSIKNVVILGKRNSRTGNRIDCLRLNTYKSNKYQDYNYVASLHIESSDFLVFAYKDYETKKTSEVYTSYQHIQDIRKGFNQMLNGFDDAFKFHNDGCDGTYTITNYGENFDLALNGLINNHSIHMIYDIDYDEERVSKKCQRGITIFFNGEENCVTITEENLKSITYFLDNFNLLSSSQHLKQMAFMYQMCNSMGLENKDIVSTEYEYSSGGTINEDSKPKRKIVKKKKE
jgi:hypothetical protein